MLVNRTHYSLMRAITHADQLVERAKELGYSYCSINDYASISGCVDFYNQCKKQGIKPLLGTDFYTTSGWLTVIAKNYDGWKEMIRLTSLANENVDSGIPTLRITDIKTKNMIVISGHRDSYLFNKIMRDGSLVKDALTNGTAAILTLAQMFGLSNVYVAREELSEVSSMLSSITQTANVKTVPICNSHYLMKEHRVEHQVVLATKLKILLRDLENTEYRTFCNGASYHIKSKEELKEQFTKAEKVFEADKIFKNMDELVDKVQEFDILGPPRLPQFKCPNGQESKAYMKELCRTGYKNKILKTDKHKKGKEYADRLNREIDVLSKINLADYFLIILDILEYVRNSGFICGPGRGSVGGSLLAYLLNITQVDPLEYDLIFERFFNKGRMTEGHISLCDIDIDVPKCHRAETIEYIHKKYGENKVGYIVTHLTMMGRASLKNVLRAKGEMEFSEINKLTSFIVDQAAIADELAQMDKPSVILWSLKHNKSKLAKWCSINKKGELEGDLAEEFKMAINLEKTKTTQSKHAAGIIISDQPLSEVCPMIHDPQSDNKIVGWEFEDAEQTGLMKCDILGLSTLDRIMDIAKLVNKEHKNVIS